MKIFFFAPFCLLRPTTNRIFDVRLCDALTGRNADVHLLYPFYSMKENIGEEEIEKVYDTRQPVQFRMLRTRLSEKSPGAWQSLVLISCFSWCLLKIIFSGKTNLSQTVFMSRDHKLLLPVVVLRKLSFGFFSSKIVINVHEVKEDRLSKWLYRNYDAIWTTTPAAKEKIRLAMNIPEEKFQSIGACLPPATVISKTEARRRINYSGEQPLVVYTGKLGRGIKELEYILDAAALLPAYRFLFTGGKEDTLAYMNRLCADRNLANVIFSGFIKEVSDVRDYQCAADVLVSYYSAKDHKVEFNLPQKLMEYMFSQNPIVTPDFPASRPFINARTARIVKPDDPHALAEGIRDVVGNKELASQLAAGAFHAAKELTFEKKSVALMESLTNMTR